MNPSVEVETLVCTTTFRRCTVKVTGDMLRRLLPAHLEIPASARVTFIVPGGADWSNMSVDVDDGNPVYVEWSSEQVTDERR